MEYQLKNGGKDVYNNYADNNYLYSEQRGSLWICGGGHSSSLNLKLPNLSVMHILTDKFFYNSYILLKGVK